MTIDLFLLLTPLFVLAIVALLGFVGCDIVFGLQPVPDPVTNLTAVAGNSQVTLTWDAFPNATDYHVVRGSGGTTTDIDTMSAANTFVDTGLTNGTTYSYFVYANTPDGQSGNSNTVSATPNAAISFVQMQPNSQATNPPPPISVTLNNTEPGNLLIVAVSYVGLPNSVSVSDSMNNTYVHVLSRTWFRQASLFYLPNIPGGNVTITATGAGGPSSMCVSEYTGADLTSAAIYSPSSNNSPSTGSPGMEPVSGLIVPLAQAGDVAYVVVMAASQTQITPPQSGFTEHTSPEKSILVEDSISSIAATDVVATINGGTSFVPWVAFAVGVKA